MKKIIIILFLIGSLNVLAKSVTLKAKASERRDVKVFLPKDFSKKEKWPLIISMHGYTGSSFIQNYYVRLGAFENKFGYVFAAPNGLKNSEKKTYWNAGNFCCDFENKQVDDVEYIKSVIDDIATSKDIGRIDLERIYLIGYSNGAFLASTIACSNKIKVAGLVTISGTSDLRDKEGELLPEDQLECQHNRAIPVLHIHGTNDETIPYEGKDNLKAGHVGALTQVKRWANHNECEGELEMSDEKINVSNFIKSKDTDYFVMQNCKAPVEHFRINDGGHFGIYKKSFTKKIIDFLFK